MARARRIVSSILLAGLCLPLAATANPPLPACASSGHVTRSLTSASPPAGLPDGSTLVARFANLSDSHILDDEASPVITGNYTETALEAGIANNSAQRLQEEYTDEVLNAMIKAINYCHANGAPMQLMIATGDLTDNMTLNETRRYIDNLDGVSGAMTAYELNCGYVTDDSRGAGKLGGVVACPAEIAAALEIPTGRLAADSQQREPFSGSDEEDVLDALAPTRSARQIADAFVASELGGSHNVAPGFPESLRCNASQSGCANAALAIPHYAVFGNHDAAVRGTVTFQQPFQAGAAAVGRYFLESQREFINEWFATTALPGPVGHGFNHVEPARFNDADDRNDGYYAFDLPMLSGSGSVRMVVANTIYDGVRSELHQAGATNSATQGVVTGNEVSNPIGVEQGVMSASQFSWLETELSGAAAAGKPVLVFSHHPDRSFTDRRLTFAADGGKTAAQVDELLGRAAFSGNANTLVAWIAGHTHENVISPCAAGSCTIGGSGPQPSVARGFWRVETASLVDYPQEGRIVEVWKLPAGGGYALKMTMIRPDPADPVANLSRTLSELEATCTTSAILGGSLSSGPYDQQRMEDVLANAGEAAVLGNFCQGQASLELAAGDASDRDVILLP